MHQLYPTCPAAGRGLGRRDGSRLTAAAGACCARSTRGWERRPEAGDEGVDEGRVELPARPGAQLGERLLVRQRVPVRALGGHRLPSVADGDDPGAERDRIAGESIGVPAPVPAFVVVEDAQQQTVVPLNYGAMPDLGRYSQPDGPAPNWSQLMPLGKIAEARAAQEEAIGYLEHDMWLVAEGMIAAGADGLDFDTAGASGDADLLATLRVVRRLRDAYPDIGVEIGQASEMVLGMHGRLEYEGIRLAGQWPLGQLRACEAAGATIFGPAVNVNTTRSLAWNTARACALIKLVTAAATIPVHVNAGMGVGGVPMSPYPPVDATSRASKALVDICKVDGL
jgi:hypothetical protein